MFILCSFEITIKRAAVIIYGGGETEEEILCALKIILSYNILTLSYTILT